MGIIARVAQVLQKGVQLGKIIIEGRHLAPSAGLRVRRASSFTHSFFYRLAVLISRLQHSGKAAMKRLTVPSSFIYKCVRQKFEKTRKPIFSSLLHNGKNCLKKDFKKLSLIILFHKKFILK